MSISLQEVITAKHELERAIEEALKRFASTTECSVEHIDLDRVFSPGEGTTYSVTTEVRL